MSVTIPTNYSWSHFGKGSHRGPSMKDVMFQIITDLGAINGRLVGLQAAHDALVSAYNLHRASAGVHVAADVDNLVAAPAATDVTTDILAIVNDAYDMYLAHISEGAAIHPGGADGTNVVNPALYPATTEAEAVALMNAIVTQYELHRANNGGAWHTNPDATNTIVEPVATEWDDLITLANAYKNTTGFNAHVILTAGPTHGATDVAHVITAADCGVQRTALFLEVNELQTDTNAHIAHLGVHPTAGAANGDPAATTEATTVTLINGLATSFNTHIASADDHLDADAATTPVAGVATEYEDIIAVVAEYRAAYNAHRVLSTVHSKADPANAGSALGVGAAVTLGTIAGTVDT